MAEQHVHQRQPRQRRRGRLRVAFAGFAATAIYVSDAMGVENYWPWGLSAADLNADGYLDVVIGNEKVKQTRVWDPAKNAWGVSEFSAPIVGMDDKGDRTDAGVRFGVVRDGAVSFIALNESSSQAWTFVGGKWQRRVIFDNQNRRRAHAGVHDREVGAHGQVGHRTPEVQRAVTHREVEHGRR